MSLPPKGHFETFDALEQHAQTHAQNHGYAIITIRWKKRYKTKDSTFRKYTIGCYCTTKYRDRMKRRCRRQRSTLKTDCQFSFHALQDADGFTLKHRDSVQYCQYNHGPTTTPAVYYQHRRLHSDALKQAKALIATRLEPKDVVLILATTLEIPPIAQDIYNLAQ
jgi:hypothetical protein